MSERKLNVFEAVLLKDNEILEELKKFDPDDRLKTIEVYAKQISMHKAAAEAIPDPIVKEIIYTKRQFIILNSALLHFQDQIHREIAGIISRLDDHDSKLYSNQNQKNDK